MRISVISSRDNPKLKQVRSLRQRSKRQATGSFLVEGIHHVGEAAAAANAGRGHLEYICFSPDLLTSEYANQLVEQQAEAGVPCYEIPGELFNSLAEKENPQGILAVMRQPLALLEALNPANFPWAVALVSPQDPGNIGAILRTIDAAGASGLILIDNSADPHHPSAIRASMGTIFWYPVAAASFGEFVEWGDRNGYTLYGTSARGSQDFRQVESYSFPLALLLGSERQGLTAGQIEHCHQLIRLPMRGRNSSLNLAVAAGVLLYDVLAKSNLGDIS